MPTTGTSDGAAQAAAASKIAERNRMTPLVSLLLGCYELAEQICGAFAYCWRASRVTVQTDSQRHLDWSAPLFVLDIQLRSVRGQEFNDIVGGLSAKMQGGLASLTDGVHLGAGSHQNLHALQKFGRGGIVVGKSARAESQARGEHERR